MILSFRSWQRCVVSVCVLSASLAVLMEGCLPAPPTTPCERSYTDPDNVYGIDPPEGWVRSDDTTYSSIGFVGSVWRMVTANNPPEVKALGVWTLAWPDEIPASLLASLWLLSPPGSNFQLVSRQPVRLTDEILAEEIVCTGDDTDQTGPDAPNPVHWKMIVRILWAKGHVISAAGWSDEATFAQDEPVLRAALDSLCVK